MCVASCSEASTPRIIIHAPRLSSGTSPVRFQFSAESDQEDWLSHLTSVCCQINNLSGRPSDNSIWATSLLGDVFTFDPTTLNTNQYNEERKLFSQEIELSATETPYTIALYNGMAKGTELEVIGYICPDADQVRFDLLTYPCKKGERPDIALHINPRFNENTLVFNTKEKSEWLDEIRDTMITFAPGAEFKLTIKTLMQGFEITVDNMVYPVYHYRTNPNGVVSFFSSGRVKIFKIKYHSPSVIMCPTDLFWRQMGGHLKKVETCKAGITWGIANDNTPYYYTGGWGGQFLKGLESSTTGIHSLTDAQNYYIYENQRWNPISGFSSTGLPTDRHCWSDVTGKHKRSKEHVKVPSTHWHWISDWMVDFHTPGGVDREGWQYAVDFPASYHGKKNFTDYVRRRRWYRKCQLSTTGPWYEVGNSKIADVSINSSGEAPNYTINVWGIAINGEVLLRRGVTISMPAGTGWDHITSETPMTSICIGQDGQVWTIGKNGAVFRRLGINCDKPCGENWQKLESNGIIFKQISLGVAGCWAIDQFGKLYNRKEITSVFPEGTHWHPVVNLCTDKSHYDGNMSFKHVSVGEYVWAVTQNGFIFKRVDTTANQSNPEYGWNIGIAANFQHICAKAL